MATAEAKILWSLFLFSSAKNAFLDLVAASIALLISSAFTFGLDNIASTLSQLLA